jgi:hypothetical protein
VLRLVVAGCSVLVAVAWSRRAEAYLSPAHGVGYGLGIAGLSLMWLQLLYTLRKRARFMRGLGRPASWFQLHMVAGVIGPAAILVHCNFEIGAVNSRIALLSMLVVAASGFAGRVLYTRIHASLHGGRLELRWLQQDLLLQRGDLAEAARQAPGVAEQLQAFERAALAPAEGFARAVSRFAAAGARARRTRIACRRLLQGGAGHGAADARRAVDAYLAAALRVVRFSAYERLFALWHVLHVPLCILLFGAAAVHVIAVHMY